MCEPCYCRVPRFHGLAEPAEAAEAAVNCSTGEVEAGAPPDRVAEEAGEPTREDAVVAAPDAPGEGAGRWLEIPANHMAQPQVPPALRNWEAFSEAPLPQQPPLPEFHGLVHDNPDIYLRECTDYITAYNISENQRTRVIEKGLKRGVERWWQCYCAMGVAWKRFQELLGNRSDSQTVKRTLVAQLYGKKQGDTP